MNETMQVDTWQVIMVGMLYLSEKIVLMSKSKHNDILIAGIKTLLKLVLPKGKALLIFLLPCLFLFNGCSYFKVSADKLPEETPLIIETAAYSLGMALMKKYPDSEDLALAVCDSLLKTQDAPELDGMFQGAVTQITLLFIDDILIRKNIEKLSTYVKIETTDPDKVQKMVDNIRVIVAQFRQGVIDYKKG